MRDEDGVVAAAAPSLRPSAERRAFGLTLCGTSEGVPLTKQARSLRLDADVIACLRKMGRDMSRG